MAAEADLDKRREGAPPSPSSPPIPQPDLISEEASSSSSRALAETAAAPALPLDGAMDSEVNVESLSTSDVPIEPEQIISLADDPTLHAEADLQADLIGTDLEATEAEEQINLGPPRSLSPPVEDAQQALTNSIQDASEETPPNAAANEGYAIEQGNVEEAGRFQPFNEDGQQPLHLQLHPDEQQQSQLQDQPQLNDRSQGPLDAIALGQLRDLINVQRPKARHYSYPTNADCDSLSMEIDEFYSYVEAPQVTENREAWEEWCELEANGDAAQGEGGRSTGEPVPPAEPFSGALGLGLGQDHQFGQGPGNDKPSNSEWTSLPTSARRKRIQSLLSLLEVKDPVARQRASRALLYLLQGSFADTHGPEHQLTWIMENAHMVRAAGGLGEIYSAFKIASWKHDWLSALPDHIPSSEPAKEGEPAPEPLLTWQTKLEYLDEINLELALHFGQLYILVETQRGEDEWGDELMSLDPPLPIYLFGLVASLREKNAKGYPVKKLLLLLWKTILASFGGLQQATRCKELARELEGLLPKPPARPSDNQRRPVVTKSTPLDLQTFQEEVAVKYPTYAPPRRQQGDLPYDKIAQAVAPIPPRRTMTATNGADEAGANGMAPFPGTPAPSPPVSPRPNKQRYQTDNTRPFPLPYSRSVQGPRMVPYSIEEASRLYRENMYVSLELWQLWRLREECIHEESGVASAADGSRLGFGSWETELKRMEKTMHDAASTQSGQSPPLTDTMGLPGHPSGGTAAGKTAQAARAARGEPTLDRLEALEQELDQELKRVEGDHMLAVVDNARYLERIAALQEKRADARRLQRVDILYRAVLPHLQSSIIVLLKLLLATVTQQNSSNSPYFQALADGIAIEDAPPPTLEDIDIVRHREITSKAISGILLLLLKWFKVSHVMKFNFLSQLLVDSNCLLLILKMFGLTEINNQVKVVNEIPNFNFFRFCELNCGQEPRKPRPEDTVMARQPFEGLPSPPMGLTHLNSSVEEVEYMDRYSFRNFFAGLNFTRILQKLTKRKIHRILLLVQYKSSAILKRTLKVPHPDLQLYALKVIKNQVPFCGRKWRQSNMKVITAIYLNCRPDLRDEWLSGADVDGDVEESLPQEQALRGLVKYYNQTRIGQPSSTGAGLGAGSTASGHGHRRSLSTNVGAPLMGDAMNADHAMAGGVAGGPLFNAAGGAGMGAGLAGAANGGAGLANANGTPAMPLSPTASTRANVNFFESEILPPLRRGGETTAGTRRYIPDDLLEGYLDDYEDILGEVFGGQEGGSGGYAGNAALDGQNGDLWHGLSAEGSQAAWERLGQILGDDNASIDSESVHSINSFGDDGQAASSSDGEGADRQTWESLSPQAMKFLTNRPATPGSPHTRRRTSSGGSGDGLDGAGGLDRLPGLSLNGNESSPSSLGLRKGSDSSPLRPVLSFGPDILEDDPRAGLAFDEEDLEEIDHMAPRPEPKAGGIDEVEHVWNV